MRGIAFVGLIIELPNAVADDNTPLHPPHPSPKLPASRREPKLMDLRFTP